MTMKCASGPMLCSDQVKYRVVLSIVPMMCLTDQFETDGMLQTELELT